MLPQVRTVDCVYCSSIQVANSTCRKVIFKDSLIGPFNEYIILSLVLVFYLG